MAADCYQLRSKELEANTAPNQDTDGAKTRASPTELFVDDTRLASPWFEVRFRKEHGLGGPDP